MRFAFVQQHAPSELIAILILTSILLACSGVSVQTGVYQTLDDARAAGALERGWIPQGLPASASDLREGHLDDGQRWGVFAFDVAEADVLRRLLDSEITDRPVHCNAPGRLEWWPLVLRGAIDIERATSTGLRFYHSRDHDLIYAVNWAQGRAYYWRG